MFKQVHTNYNSGVSFNHGLLVSPLSLYSKSTFTNYYYLLDSLAAITTLYLMETAKYSRQFSQATLQAAQRSLPTKRPSKSPKIRTTYQSLQPHQTTLSYRDSEVTKVTVDASQLLKRPSYIIGRPSKCGSVEQDLENTNLCEVSV